MRYSPCGMGVDLIKYPYEAPCRFIDDPAAPTSTVRWTPIRPGAEMLPFPSVIHNLVMDPEHTRWDLPVGEQWDGFGRKATWVTTPPAITGHRFCGVPSDFFDGSVYDPDPPLAVYGANKWLLCCAQAPVLFGGAGANGTIVPAIVRAIAVYGAAGASGLIRPFAQYPHPVGGTKGGGGPVGFALVPKGVPGGGGKATAFMPVALVPAGTPSGGGKATAFMPVALVPAGTPSGGGKATAFMPVALVPAGAPSGGGKAGGAVAFGVSVPGTPSGGGKGGGTIAHTWPGWLYLIDFVGADHTDVLSITPVIGSDMVLYSNNAGFLDPYVLGNELLINDGVNNFNTVVASIGHSDCTLYLQCDLVTFNAGLSWAGCGFLARMVAIGSGAPFNGFLCRYVYTVTDSQLQIIEFDGSGGSTTTNQTVSVPAHNFRLKLVLSGSSLVLSFDTGGTGSLTVTSTRNQTSGLHGVYTRSAQSGDKLVWFGAK